MIYAKTNQFYMSFLPASVRAWNNLSVESQQCESVTSFKRLLQKDSPKVPKHFYSGPRKSQILLSRLRTNCSSLNFDFFVKNVADNPLFRCGSIAMRSIFSFIVHFTRPNATN